MEKTIQYKGMNIPLPYNTKCICFPDTFINKYPNGYFKEKECRFCGKGFIPLAPSHNYCCEQCAVYGAADSYLFRNYKITLNQYLEMYYTQKGKCYICKTEGFALKNNIEMKLVIDHSHEKFQVRGLLCPNCNRALGLFKDSPERLQKALEYITKKHTIPEDKPSAIKRTFRKRVSNKPNLTEQELFLFYDDVFIKLLRTQELCNKYNITKETVRAIKEGKSYQKILLKYQERATTIQ